MKHEFGHVIASNIRRLRTEQGVTADELASRMRSYGLRWGRPTVSQVETGARRLLAEEGYLIAEALGVEVESLFRPEKPVAISASVTIEPDGLNGSRVVVGDAPGLGHDDMVAALREVIGVIGPNMNGELIARAKAGRDADLNLRTAKHLGLTALQASALALSLWGTDITAERDRRATRDRGSRGHVTRSLQREMREALRKTETPASAQR